ncbi:MAG: NUDIX hydrolase [Planctomycetes bacterium]|nr:NUDIX hydrolase [Planctomycetota bacterium]
MHRQNLLAKLNAYTPTTEGESRAHGRMVEFVAAHPNCFERRLAVGHITGSAWLLDATGTKALLTHHRKLGKWLQLGGHADGDPDVLAVAVREATEESGLTDIRPLSGDIFDVDVHRIPAHGDTPAHDHYDIRFLLQATSDDPIRISDESIDLRWFTHAEVPLLDTDDSVLRMNRKWAARMAHSSGSEGLSASSPQDWQIP